MMLRILFAILSRLPLRTLHALGDAVGWLLWVTHSSRRRVALRNIERCFPELEEEEHHRIARSALAHEAKSITEYPLLWLGPPSRMMNCLKEVRGQELLDEAIARGQGLLLLTLHMGSFEGPAIPYSAQWTITGLYKPQKSAINELSVQGRTRFKGELLPTEVGVRRKIVPLLKANGQVYFLPDQDPAAGRGVYAPFFGIPAHTPVLVARLLRECQPRVLYFFGERLPRGQGYIMHVFPASPEIHDSDVQTSVAAMNRDLESIVRKCPEQYWWGYRRFRRQPEGASDFYANL